MIMTPRARFGGPFGVAAQTLLLILASLARPGQPGDTWLTTAARETRVEIQPEISAGR
jgi:hypothetical protein